MPKELKKRGRREDKKRKRDEEEAHVGPAAHSELQDVQEEWILLESSGVEHNANQDATSRPEELTFYGLLDEQEQEYFKQADSMLEMNTFGDDEERDLFLTNVYKEAKGKELKIANSQSCSRLMERLILLSNAEQLKGIFQKFHGQFLNLVQHRFASHCCEALFLQAAPVVVSEMKATPAAQDTQSWYVSMESLFLSVVNELETHFGYLLSDTFASHPLRVLLAVLSGMPLAASDTKVTLGSKKKENVSVTLNSPAGVVDLAPRTVSSAFQSALDKMIAGMVAGLETSSARALATQPIANPVLQLVLQIELSTSKKQSVKEPGSLLNRLLPDDPLVDGTESAAFIQHLLYDSVGSRLLEVIVSHAPGRTFKALYRNLMKDKLATVARNEIAVFVIIKLIERLGKEDLQSATEQLCPCLDTLIQRSRTGVIRTLIERSRAREVDTGSIADALRDNYGDNLSQKFLDILQITTEAPEGMSADRKKQLESQNMGKIHASLLMQTMLEWPGPLRELTNNWLLSLDTPDLKNIAQDRSASRVIQVALTGSEQSAAFRRLFIQRFIGMVTDLTIDPVASHVVDALWIGSSDLMFLRERMAGEMMSNEEIIRGSFSGRAIWRNWKMDVYKSRRQEWLREGKGEAKPAKSGIELARERYIKKSVNRLPVKGRNAKSH